MRLFLLGLLFLALQQADATRIRLLLRDESDTGVAGATLLLRTENGQAFTLTTDTSGVAVSDQLSGKAVWLMRGQRADASKLVADSYPAEAGFRLVLIPGQVRDALLRLDGDQLVLDPDMIFSPEDPHAPQPAPPQLVATVAPITDAALPITSMQPLKLPAIEAPLPTRSWSTWIVLAVAAIGLVLVALALLIGLARRRQP